MTLTYTYDGAAVTHNIAPSTVSLVSAAELGEASTSGLQIEDPGSTLTMLGHRPFVVEESACSQPRLFTGWTTSRGVGRSVGDGMFGDATAGVHDVTVIDLNALFNWRTITGADGNRPAETFAARLAWLLGSSYLTGLIEDTGYIVVNTTAMDAADYRDGYPSAVMDDLMDRSGSAYNYFAFWDPTAAAVGLWVGHLDDAVSTSTLRISNVAADVDGTTTFPPDEGARLAITPTETYSEVTVEYAKGTKRLFRSRASTATKYIQRGAKIQRPYTGSATTASNQAERFLDQHANEEDRITVTIIVPAAKAGLLTAGQRLDVKLSHLPGYTAFTSMRCVRLTVTPTNDLATHYALALELAAPRPAAAANPCENPTADGHYRPNWSGTSQADGMIVYLRAGLAIPTEPTPNFDGAWHFPTYKVANASVPSGFADHVSGNLGNKARLFAIGPGTMSIYFLTYDSPGNYANVYLRHTTNGAESGVVTDWQQLEVYGSTGSDPTLTVDVPADGYCTHWVELQFPTHMKFGGFDWVAGEVDTEVTLPPVPGTLVTSDVPTPAPDGTTVLFTLAGGYLAGSLIVYVDGLPIPSSQVTETDPGAGTFTLSWAVDADESITATYVSA